MIRLTILSLLLCANVWAQQFNFPKTTQFYDVPGDNFLSYEVQTGKLLLRENDGNGDMLWSDTLEFHVAIDTIEKVYLARFGTSNSYVIALQKTLFPYSFSQLEFPIVYQFTRLDMDSHTLGNTVIDTITSRYGLRLFSYNDSAVNVLYHRKPDNINDDNYEVWTLNASMQLSPLAPYQNTIATMLWDNFDMKQDTIRQYISLTDGVARFEYTPQFAQIPPPQSYFIPYGNFDFVGVYMSHLISSDSLLLFHQSTMTGNSMTNWGFTLLNNWLDPLSGYTFTAPTTTDEWGSTLYYQARKAVYKDGLIYVFANLLVNGQHPKIFVYDMNFTLQCEMDVPFYSNEQQYLGVINNQVYFYAYTAQVLDQYCFFKLDNCQFLEFPSAEMARELNVFPNPSQGTVQVVLPNVQANGTLRIHDMNGKLIQKQAIQGNDTVFISVKEKGVYILEVVLSDTIWRKKLMVQ